MMMGQNDMHGVAAAICKPVMQQVALPCLDVREMSRASLCVLLQHDDPPEQVGSYKYCSHHNPHGPDTVSRWHATTGQQEVVLSADIMQEDAARLTRLLNVPVQGGL